MPTNIRFLLVKGKFPKPINYAFWISSIVFLKFFSNYILYSKVIGPTNPNKYKCG